VVLCSRSLSTGLTTNGGTSGIPLPQTDLWSSFFLDGPSLGREDMQCRLSLFRSDASDSGSAPGTARVCFQLF
jgi:hypothetical protein